MSSRADAAPDPGTDGPTTTTTSTTASARPGTAAGGARSAYTTLASPHSLTLEVKKSKFITTAWPITSPEQGLAAIAAAGDPSASHNCWALVCGAAFRCSDDGEPAGTAGRPILAAIQGEGLDGVAVLVTRFFGGTKLGTGGLVRAYGSAARECLRAAPRATVQPASTVVLTAPLADVGLLYEAVAAAGGERAGEEGYGQGGQAVILRACVPSDRVAGLASSLASKTAGRAAFVVEEE